MLRIYLTRHGQDEDNAKGILNGRRNESLTSLGVEQANKLAQEIKGAGFTFDAVYSSPLLRAYNTAKVVTEALNLEKPTIMKDLVERDFGVMTGKAVKDIEDLCAPNIIKANPIVYFLSPEGAERVAFPGYSEHGAPRWPAIDFVTMKGMPSDKNPLDFVSTEEYRWLLKNAHRFGFYLSYPKNNKDGIMYEPWHWRFEK